MKEDDEKKVSFKKWSEDDFKNSILENRGNYCNRMLHDFFNHFSECDAKGKMKFQLEKTWQTSKRLAKWRSNNYGKYDRDEQAAKNITQSGISSEVGSITEDKTGDRLDRRRGVQSTARAILGIQES